MSGEIDVYFDEEHGRPWGVVNGESVWLEDNGDGTFDVADIDDFEFDDDDEGFEPSDPEVDPRLVEDVQYSLSQLTEKIGRQLTQGEQQAAVRGALDRVRKGQFPDVAAALEEAGTPVKAVTAMNTHEHRDWARERYRELQDADKQEPDEQEFDMESMDGMRAYAKARLNGYEPVEEED